ncbi:hypothetical protein ACFE04_029303 [Oxalis oulophora]
MKTILFVAIAGLLLIHSAIADYGDALDKTLLFFEAQRSGKLPASQQVKWRGDSGLKDGFLQGVDLVGGYYDAGDHVKFGLPMAFSVTMLAWGTIHNRKEISELDQLGNTLRAIKWGSDYFIKAHTQPNVLWAQLFTFADRYRGLYDDSIPCAKQFYTSSGYSDELLWAATWLYRATGDEYYLKYVAENAEYMGGTGWAMKEFSWDNKYAGVQILLSKILMEGQAGRYTNTLKQYQAKANYFACACVQKNGGYNVQLTPGGLMYVREWNNLQYASSAAFLLAVYSDYLSTANAKITCPNGQVQHQELMNFAKSQADYILGKNPKYISYLVGYGSKYPAQVHHRGSSIASIYSLHSIVGCVQGFETWYRRSQGNPNVIYGALVGGPDQNDNFSDERSNYEQTEPTLTAAAPLIGLFTKLQSIYKPTGYLHPSQSSNIQQYSLSSTSKQEKTTYKQQPENPIEFLHSITSSWTVGQTTHYRHKVVVKNTSQKTITDLKLGIQNLSGSIYGLIPSDEKNVYELPEWQKVMNPGSELIFVYVQDGPQAKVSVLSYH